MPNPDTLVEVAYRDEGNSRVSVDPTQPLPVSDAALRSSDKAESGQKALSTTSAVAVVRRAGRRRLVVKNIDTALTVYVGFASPVTSGNGVPLLAGESTAFYTQAALYGLAASGTPTVAFWEEYD